MMMMRFLCGSSVVWAVGGGADPEQHFDKKGPGGADPEHRLSADRYRLWSQGAYRQ